MMACLNGHLQALPLLLSAGADVDACDNRFKKQHSYAVMLVRVDLMRELILHNANMCSLDGPTRKDSLRSGLEME